MDELIDGRFKLMHCQIERVKQIRERSGWSYETIAKIFLFNTKISRQTIWLICNPEKREQARATSRNLHTQKRYYDKEKQKEKVGKNRAKHLTLKDIFGKKEENNE